MWAWPEKKAGRGREVTAQSSSEEGLAGSRAGEERNQAAGLRDCYTCMF